MHLDADAPLCAGLNSVAALMDAGWWIMSIQSLRIMPSRRSSSFRARVAASGMQLTGLRPQTERSKAACTRLYQRSRSVSDLTTFYLKSGEPMRRLKSLDAQGHPFQTEADRKCMRGLCYMYRSFVAQ